MLKSYLRIALRGFRKHKVYTLINVLGLAAGIAVCALLLLWVRDELSYDRFHEKAERIYRVLWKARAGNNEWTLARTPVPLGDLLNEHFPEVENVVRFTTAARTIRLGETWNIEERVLRVESRFFEVFTLRFVNGGPETALNDPGAVVLTESAANRYFPGRNAVGEALELNDGQLLQVTGVVEDLPPQSHFDFEFLLPLEVARLPEWQRTEWGTPPVYTYFALRPGADESAVARRLDEFIREKVLPDSPFTDSDSYYQLPLQRLTDIHLHSNASLELGSNGNVAHIYVFSLIAFFVLLLACVNFVNLATARAASRALEVGIRKVVGSRRAQLIRQFLTESLVYVGFALVLAMVLIEATLPAFNGFTSKQLSTNYLGSPFSLIVLLSMAGSVVLLAGAYPAVVLSAFQPAYALKGARISGRGRDWMRSGLVVAQFCISIGLIAGTLVVRNQLDFVQEKQLGFEREHVLIVENAGMLQNQHAIFRERLRSQPLVVAASGAQSLPGRSFDSMLFAPEQPAGFERSSVDYSWIDEQYVDVLGLTILEGRNFDPSRSADSSSFLINEAALKALGWNSAVGKTIVMGNGIGGQVIGVVENFHYESLHHEIEPAIFPFARWTPPTIAVRLRPRNTGEAIAAVRQVWEEFVPHQPFTYSFLDQDYDRLYRSEQQVARILGLFSGIALFIACLGLLGLASYVVLRRTKEIGIRKVLGASTSGITLLLTREFAAFVLVAFLIATPAAYFGMSRWLENFAYRVEIGPGIFLWAGGVALLLAVLTVCSQAIRAALTDPVRSLRYE